MTALPLEANRRAILRGILFMCLAVSMFPFLNAAVKYLSADYPVTQIVWARYAGHLLVVVAAFWPRLRGRLFATSQPGMQILRSLLLLGSTCFYFLALGYLPLATAAAIGFTAPFIVTALSVPMLGEPVGPRRWAAVGVGFIGALIIIRPGTDVMHWATFLVLANAACYGLYQVLTRKLAARDDPRTTITYTALVGAVLASLVLPLDWRLPADPLAWALFASLGFFGGFGHFFVVKAYEFGPAAVIAPFGYGQLVGSVTFGLAIFGDFPDLYTWIGAAIIIACGIYIMYRESLRRGKAAA